MKLEIENEIMGKAKSKKDGCYRHKGIAYKVTNGNVTHFADFGTIFERMNGFNVIVGKYEFSMYPDEVGQKILKGIK